MVILKTPIKDSLSIPLEEYFCENNCPTWGIEKINDRTPSELFGYFDSPEDAQREYCSLRGSFPELPQNAAISQINECDWKNEYKKFLQLFAACPSLEQAHCLSGMVFGAQRAVHLTGIQPEELYETGSCRDAQPFLYSLRNRQRPGRPPREKSAFRDKSMEKAAQLQQYLERQAALRAQLEYYIGKGRLDFSQLEDTITPAIRTSFLAWIVKANANASKRARTEYGQSYTLCCRPGEICVLHCTDGDLTMPAYCLIFDEDTHDG